MPPDPSGGMQLPPFQPPAANPQQQPFIPQGGGLPDAQGMQPGFLPFPGGPPQQQQQQQQPPQQQPGMPNFNMGAGGYPGFGLPMPSLGGPEGFNMAGMAGLQVCLLVRVSIICEPCLFLLWSLAQSCLRSAVGVGTHTHTPYTQGFFPMMPNFSSGLKEEAMHNPLGLPGLGTMPTAAPAARVGSGGVYAPLRVSDHQTLTPPD